MTEHIGFICLGAMGKGMAMVDAPVGRLAQHAIHGTTASNGQLKINHATKVLTGDIEPGFAIDLAHKDLTLIVNAANQVKVPLPIAVAACESVSLARSTKSHDKDFSALLDRWCGRAGVKVPRL